MITSLSTISKMRFYQEILVVNVLFLLVVGEHVIECVIEFIRTLLDLQLLSVDFVLNVINSLVQLGDVHLSILKSSFSNFELKAMTY